MLLKPPLQVQSLNTKQDRVETAAEPKASSKINQTFKAINEITAALFRN